MKSKPIRRQMSGFCSFLILTSAIPAVHAQVSVDGSIDGSEGYTEQTVQTITAGWGATNTLANLHTAQEDSNLFVFMGGKTLGNAIILFIDSKPGGPTFIPNNLIASGGEEYTINNLGSSDSAGLTFESGFEPDHAVRIYADGSGTTGYVNRYDLQAGSRAYVGQCVAALPAPSGFITEIQAVWTDAAAPYADVADGVEMMLNLAALGVPTGTSPVKMVAMLVNDGSSWGSNQMLASKSTDADLADGLNAFNMETEPGTQTVSLTVDFTDTDGDGDPDDIDTDDDDDGLLDTEENNTGTYVSPTETGTNPLIADSDGDGAMDGEEVLDDYFGFLSDPNIANYELMAIPGSFTDPAWQPDGSAGNEMTMVGTSLAEQYEWTLDYQFNTLGSIEYKYAANGDYTNSWGDGGGNIFSTIEATGFHRFAFNNSTLARSFSRITFPDQASFLAAYGLTAGGDEDSDSILNEDEFTANTDPTNIDTDGDGVTDDTDPDPLFVTRDIVFTVDMTVQEALGNFDPLADTVVVDFFDGLAGPLADLALTDPEEDGTWTGTLTAFQGPTGASFGTYKFRNSNAGAPDSGYEGAIDNRTFDLGAGATPQVLDTVYFNNDSSQPGTYGFWSTVNAGGQGAGEDFDGDGMENGVEYFMGQTGSSFTPNPAPVSGMITWPRDPAATGVAFKIWTSENLSEWDDVTVDADISEPSAVKYNLPTATPSLFVRFEVVVD